MEFVDVTGFDSDSEEEIIIESDDASGDQSTPPPMKKIREESPEQVVVIQQPRYDRCKLCNQVRKKNSTVKLLFWDKLFAKIFSFL